MGLVAHFLEGALRNVCGHGVDKAIFAIKQETATFWAERVLLGKAGFNLQAFLMRQRQSPSHATCLQKKPDPP
jgi:hypothetical protein